VTKSAVVNLDQYVIVCPQQVSRFDDRDVIRAHVLPIGPTRDYGPGHLRAVEGSAEDRHHTLESGGGFAHHDRRVENSVSLE